MGNYFEYNEGICVMPKFDVVIMNPPYYRNLHLKILEKVIPIADSWYGAPKKNEWCYANINKFNILITKYI